MLEGGSLAVAADRAPASAGRTDRTLRVSRPAYAPLVVPGSICNLLS